MVLTRYESTTNVARYPQLSDPIKDPESIWKERLARHALRAIEIDGNVNRDPDFLMKTPLTQIQYEYDKRLGKTTPEVYIPPKEFTQQIEKKEEPNKQIGSRLTGKADYSLNSYIFKKS